MTMFEVVRKAMLAGFGVQEVVKGFIDDLVQKGELSEAQGAKLVREWTEKAEKTSDEINKTVSEMVKTTLERMRIPSPDEFRTLSEEVRALSARVKKLEEPAPPVPPRLGE